MIIKEPVYFRIMHMYPIVPPENGGIIGGIGGVVDTYFHDPYKNSLKNAIYEPNTALLNEIICTWDQMKIDFMGVVHSHQYGQYSLSAGDIEYINAIMQSIPNKIDHLLFPIIIPNDKIYSYVAKRTGTEIKIESDTVEII